MSVFMCSYVFVEILRQHASKYQI